MSTAEKTNLRIVTTGPEKMDGLPSAANGKPAGSSPAEENGFAALFSDLYGKGKPSPLGEEIKRVPFVTSPLFGSIGNKDGARLAKKVIQSYLELHGIKASDFDPHPIPTPEGSKPRSDS